MDLDLRQLRYFVTLAEELHFGRAAAKLFITQPALSKQIRKLEDQLGGPLLERDSRHVTLTPRGKNVLADAREMLSLAARIGHRPDAPDSVRIAHIFELQTSRTVADNFATSYPGIRIVERALDSIRQLEALLDDRLDVAILRITPAMIAEHPAGWRSRLLRLEPLQLVGRPADPPRPQASLHSRPLEVFADGPESGLYNAHGHYLTAFEHDTGLPLRWLGNPGTFGHCLAALQRAAGPAYLLEFDSYATRYAAAGIPVHRPLEIQPYYPWSVAWRDEPLTEPVAKFLAVAERTAHDHDWAAPSPHLAPPWLPPGDTPAAPTPAPSHRRSPTPPSR
ncbi:LysR family transcriptional regulator [Nocardia stercoris]|uniref:LysR family transcriptional regulator n=1 Tax=Nocardia stercoris TaxID=2483361 RepID=A0A3M2L3N5_9NOCA|nr:LysR family transcriptional regulator [Nocardia stercoris]RMI32329.1 LysR family transcriptional regulator [Nocardia stercoris]